MELKPELQATELELAILEAEAAGVDYSVVVNKISGKRELVIHTMEVGSLIGTSTNKREQGLRSRT